MFSLNERFEKKLDYERLYKFLPYRAWDPETGIYILDIGKQTRIGWFFVCSPIGPKKEFAHELESLIASLPEKSTLQLSICGSPFLKSIFRDFMKLRNRTRLSKQSNMDINSRKILRFMLTEKLKNFIKMTSNSRSTSYPYLYKTLVVYISFTIPSSEAKKSVEIKNKTQAILTSAGFNPETGRPLDLYDLLSFLFKRPRGIAFPSDSLKTKKWLQGKRDKNGELKLNQDDLFVSLSELITPADMTIKIKSDRIVSHDGQALMSISYKSYPSEPPLDVCNRLLGDPDRAEMQLPVNFFHTLNIYIPEQSKIKEKLTRKHAVAAWQAFGPMAKFNPKLRKVKEELAYIMKLVEEQSLCEAYLHTVLVAEENKIDEVSGSFLTFAKRLNFYPVKDRFILLPLVLNSLPMSLSPAEIPKLFRKRTLTSEMCARIAPIQGDGGRFGSPVLLFGTRRGFVFGGDIFASPTAYNGLIFGGTGGGKSFLLNEIIASYFSVNGKIIVIDVGRSFEKLCSVFKGEHIEFSEKSPININPFAHLSLSNKDEFAEEMEMLKNFMEIMCAPREGFSDYQKAALTEILNRVIEKYGAETTFDAIASELKEHNDQRIKDLAVMLLPWIGKGENSRWMTKGRPIDFENDLIVIEMEELGSRPLLRAVALYYLIYRISFDFLQKSMRDMKFKSKPKFLFIDEAWELLKAGNVDFIERGYRRFRKTGSGIWIISQSPTDLEGTDITDAVWANSQFVISMRVEAFDREVVKKRLSEYAVEAFTRLKTLTGEFSEFYFKSPWGEELVRFYAPRFTQLVYTTNPKEVARIEFYRERGLDYASAIARVVQEETEMERK